TAAAVRPAITSKRSVVAPDRVGFTSVGCWLMLPVSRCCANSYEIRSGRLVLSTAARTSCTPNENCKYRNGSRDQTPGSPCEQQKYRSQYYGAAQRGRAHKHGHSGLHQCIGKNGYDDGTRRDYQAVRVRCSEISHRQRNGIHVGEAGQCAGEIKPRCAEIGLRGSG